MGFKPSDDPKADKLVNSNMPQQDEGMPGMEGMEGEMGVTGAEGGQPIDLEALKKVPLSEIRGAATE